ncbi:excalibur calcium-binding domain-containing protein [Sulfurimonas sp.]|jgi:hypothetical protein|uniref:excalibur calcium-binding domain-containing protein n=1 Tax=Sulfurimonas sp. TaxID=2022749 RepID=UPI002A36114F|nr:excalibur calcium-binding domain-containing protein [Sulfurimonas sp.]MDY0123617.1 excalibur calcium-binding domain-containing protein [Sulfurimonas sp.]
MKKVILLMFILLTTSATYAEEIKTNFDKHLFAKSQPKFKCDGRKYCSQMSSCEEAKFFLRNCPDQKTDGDGDGIPCEKQHCISH